MFVSVIVCLPKPAPMANDRVVSASRTSPWEQLQGNYPGSMLSFGSGNAIKRINGGVKACR